MPQRKDTISQPADAIAMLKADHQRVRDLFQQYQAAKDPQAKRDIAEEVFVELETHTQLEEQIFYPAVNEDTEEGPELVKESLDEHDAVKQLIQDMRDMDLDAKGFDAKFKELMHDVEHHVEEEESEMFPLAEQELAESMPQLKQEMQELKEEITAS